MKVALVHDWLTNMGGSEKVLLQLHNLFPDAPIYTSIYNPKKVDASFRGIKVIPSFLQKLPFAKEKYQMYLPLMPLAFEQFDLREYDLIISSSHACAKGVIPSPHATHICYCHTPMRYAWSGYHQYLEREKIGFFKKMLMLPAIHYLRLWDKLSSDRVDHFIANSNEVAIRIMKYYKREATVIHPPVFIPQHFNANTHRDYYLILGRLVAYKRVDLAIEAFNNLQKKLFIIGDGPEMERLKKRAGPTIKLLGRLNDEQTRDYLKYCKAFIFPGEEDFGITPVEAQSYGKPVIAYGKGGALDTVIEGKTGIFFYEQTVDSLIKAVQKFENCSSTFSTNFIFEFAKTFSEETFLYKIRSLIHDKVALDKAN